MRRSRRIGNLAEDSFRTWASAAGAVKNASIEDANGWDFIVELELTPNETNFSPGTLDRDLRGMKALVQVKGTDSSDGHRDIKLSNAKSLIADSPLPAFLCIIEFDGTDTPQNVYLVHLGQEFAESVLRRLRKLTPADQSRLNKQYVRVQYCDDDRIAPTGTALRSALVEPVQGSPRKYEHEKNRWLNELGYDESILRFKPKLPNEYDKSQLEFVSEFIIGFRDKIEIDSMEIQDIRFGIPDPQPATFKGGKLEIGRSKADVLVILSTAKSEQRARVNGQLYRPFAPTDMIAGAKKARISTSLFEMVMYLTEDSLHSFGFHPQLERPAPLDKLREGASAIRLVDQALDQKESVLIDLVFTTTDKPAKLDQNKIRLGRVDPTEYITSINGSAREWKEFAIVGAALDNAISICTECNIPLTAKTTWSHVSDHRLAYHIIKGLIDGEDRFIRCTYSHVPENLISERCGHVVTALTQIGEWRLVLSLGMIGTLTKVEASESDTGSISRFTSDLLHLYSIEAYHAGEEIPSSSLDLWQRGVEKLEAHAPGLPIIKDESGYFYIK